MPDNVLSSEPRTEFASAHVRHWGTSGSQMLIASFSLFAILSKKGLHDGLNDDSC
jgi:hypothetical protein